MTDPFLILGSDPDLQEGEKKARKSIGETRGRYRTLKYLDRGRWVPAVYHESVRHYLIGLARKLGEYGKFIFHLILIIPFANGIRSSTRERDRARRRYELSGKPEVMGPRARQKLARDSLRFRKER